MVQVVNEALKNSFEEADEKLTEKFESELDREVSFIVSNVINKHRLYYFIVRRV